MAEQERSGDIALITGAAKRIGRVIALDLARHGSDIAIHYNTSREAAESLATEIRSLGRKAVTLQADLSQMNEVGALVPACVESLGPPNCLINNGSRFENDKIETLTAAEWDAHLDINLRAPVFLAQSFAQALPKGEKGTVVNLIDQRVLKPRPLYFSYSVSKAALWTATCMLAQALAPHIRVNAIGPGPVLQSIHQSPEQFAAEQRGTLLGHGASPGDIARAVRFILDVPAMTGQMIVIDGGQHLTWRNKTSSDE